MSRGEWGGRRGDGGLLGAGERSTEEAEGRVFRKNLTLTVGLGEAARMSVEEEKRIAYDLVAPLFLHPPPPFFSPLLPGQSSGVMRYVGEIARGQP
ncbi:hypothetical protein KM043_014586 [Ampulex compressa]|nr:hypothetical protein KM043_014586 [Ampulex compressa]